MSHVIEVHADTLSACKLERGHHVTIASHNDNHIHKPAQ